MTTVKIVKKPPVIMPGKKLRKGAKLSDYIPEGVILDDLETIKLKSWRSPLVNSKTKKK